MPKISDDILRNGLIEKITQGFSQSTSPPSFPPILTVDLQGKILTYNTEARNFIFQHFNLEVAKLQTIFHLIPLDKIEQFAAYFHLEVNCSPKKKEFCFDIEGTKFFLELTRLLNVNCNSEQIQIRLGQKISKPQKLQDQLRLLMDNASIGIFLTKPNGQILDVNKAANKMFGYKTKDFIKNGRHNLFDPSNENLAKLLEERKQNGQVTGEITAINSKGELFPVRVYSVIYKDSTGEEFTSTIIIDISLQKQQEQALARSLENLEALYENHPDAVFSFDLEGSLTGLNSQGAQLIEAGQANLLGQKFSSLFSSGEQDKTGEFFWEALEGNANSYNTKFYSKTGNSKILDISNFPILTKQGIIGVYAIVRDVTNAEKQKQTILDSQLRLEKIMNQSLDIICTIDEHGILKEVSAASSAILGYSPKELIATKFYAHIFSEDKDSTIDISKKVLNGLEITNFSNKLIKKDGNSVPIIWSLRWDAGDKLMYCVGKDASDIKRAQNEILQERAMLKALIENIPDYIYAVDQNQKTILTNKRFYSEYLGKISEHETLELSPRDYFPGQEGEDVMRDNSRILGTGEPVLNRKEVVYDHKNNKETILLNKVPFSTDKGISGLVCIARNITEAHNLEMEQKFISQLINSIGKAQNVKFALAEMIALISGFMNFEEAEAWEVGYANTSLIKSANYSQNSNYQSTVNTISFKKGEGLPGVTWNSSKIQVWKDLENDHRFTRKSIIKDSKLDLGIGVPIIYKSRVVSVLIFFSQSINHNQRDIKKVLERIAFQISTGVRRKMNENRLNNMFNHSPYLIAILGMDGYLKKVNPAFSRIFGYTQEELLNTPFSNFLHDDEKTIITKRLTEVVEGNTPKSFQNRCLSKSGGWKWISWTPSELIEEEGIVHLFGIDITSIKSTNQELLKYRNIIESSKDGIGLFTIENREIFLNTALKNILGIENSEGNKLKSIEDYYVNKDIISRIFPVLMAGKFWDGDVQLKLANGTFADYHLSGGPVFDEKGELIALYGIHTDVKERKKYEDELQAYTTKLFNVLESITDGFFSVTPSFEVTYWNKEAENLLGVAKKDILHKYLWDFFPAAKKTLFYSNYQQALKTGKKVAFEEYSETLGKWFEVNAFPGKEGLSVFFKDVTQSRKINEEIRLAKERYDLVSKATREAIYDWDIEKNLLVWSESYNEIYGFPKVKHEESLAQWEKYLHKDDRDRVVKYLNACIASNKTKWVCEYRLVQANKKIAVVLERGYIVRDEEGKALRMIGSLKDVTELKQNERALEELNHKLKKHADELATSNAELEQFAYIASHDLQEPLRMVTSFLSQLQKKYDDKLDDRAKQYIHFATDGAVRMRQILLDLLEYSRAGRLDYQLQEIDLNSLMLEIIQLHQNLIEEKGAVVTFGNLPIIKGSLTPIQRVLSNLISNGIKYSKEGVAPQVKVVAVDHLSYWEIQVIDTGIGINERFFDKIFVIFQRLHSKDEYSGTGIGLAICKKIIDNHGGKIWVTSIEGKGSTFHFTINKQF